MQVLQLYSRELVDTSLGEKTMNTSVTIAPMNSIVVVSDGPNTGGPTEMERGSGIAANRYSIVVGCFLDVDRATRITLGPSPAVAADCRLAFDGFLDTPHHRVAVWTVEWEKLLEARVPTARTRIRIWTNHVTEPDDVYIKVGE
jgi:hypothetical protein